jgi:hypothetical protein
VTEISEETRTGERTGIKTRPGETKTGLRPSTKTGTRAGTRTGLRTGTSIY